MTLKYRIFNAQKYGGKQLDPLHYVINQFGDVVMIKEGKVLMNPDDFLVVVERTIKFSKEECSKMTGEFPGYPFYAIGGEHKNILLYSDKTRERVGTYNPKTNELTIIGAELEDWLKTKNLIK